MSDFFPHFSFFLGIEDQKNRILILVRCLVQRWIWHTQQPELSTFGGREVVGNGSFIHSIYFSTFYTN